jgi:uncharacterized damage-inducible protein DinB
MSDLPSTIATIYSGWETYQGLIAAALRPLTREQLALSAAPGLRTIGQISAHMIGARARWFHGLMGDGLPAFEPLGRWDRHDAPPRDAAELAHGLAATWQGMQAAIASWTPADWQETFPGEPPSEPAVMTRAWVIWHLIEHDLHHGGEISLTLGVHGLSAPDI